MKKLNNKGFSLVELIIVIAIMAILVGVVGTQVIPYLENSRKAKDIQILSAWNTAAVSAYSTEAGQLDSTGIYKIRVDKTQATCTTTTLKGASNLTTPFQALTAITKYEFDKEMSSKAGKEIDYVEITVDGKDGKVETVTHMTSGSKYSFDPIENK